MFIEFREAVKKQFEYMAKHNLYRVNIDKDLLWEMYLTSFPNGTNPLYKERTTHDCQACKHFIRNVGAIVSIIDGKIVTIWDIEAKDEYELVAKAMAEFVRSVKIDNEFLTTEKTLGVVSNLQCLGEGNFKKWDHFCVSIPPKYVKNGKDIGPILSMARSTYDVFLRALKEIKTEEVETVLELIAQNSLYRGEEYKSNLTGFLKAKKEFAKIKNKMALDQELFAWSQGPLLPPAISRIRSTAIGKLLVDLSEGADFESTILSFEAMMSPVNYKRPTALVSKAMIQKAKEKIEELGFTSALERRYANVNDITVNNLLFVDRSTKKEMGIFDKLEEKVPQNAKKLSGLEEITIEAFIENILPKVDSIQILLENSQANNLVSLIAPVDPESKSMFKWPNNFSWSYIGEVTDSIKEKVKAAGGNVTGYLRCSLAWHNFDDLDIHLTEPLGEEIYFAHRNSHSSLGSLDVDMNAGGSSSRTPVENIVHSNKTRVQEGLYKLRVHNYSKRETIDVGFEAEIEFNGNIYNFAYPQAVKNGEYITVAEFKFTHKHGVELIKSLPTQVISRPLWGIPTQTFHKVRAIMLSPNYWDEHKVGNKHYFFMLEGCINEGQARGFFNEFLVDELTPHRKVFEQVGAHMKTENSDQQLSGLGFSSTQHSSLICQVKGTFSRILKINF
jgi:hypothetical protein